MGAIDKKISSLSMDNISLGESKSSLLGEFLQSKETDFKDVIGMTVDTLLAGIDTVTLKCFIVKLF